MPILALGISLMVGFSAWQAAQDVVSAISTAPTGSIGGQQIDTGDEAVSGVAAWIGMIPNSMLFIGLSFGMIITISLASFCLGRALQAFNILTLTARVGDDVKALIEGLNAKITAFRKLRDTDEAERRKLPFDVKSKFAREAAHAGWKVAQAKLAAARRKFSQINDPLANPIDPVADTIPAGLTSEDDFARHLADQTDVLRLHNILRVLTGLNPQTEEDKP